MAFPEKPAPLAESLHFVLPADHELPSGGNIYNEKLISALQALGQEINKVTFEQYREALIRQDKGIYLVDSLFVEELRQLNTSLPAGMYSIFIMHHLQSLDPPQGISTHDYFEQHERKALEMFNAFLATSPFSAHYLAQQGLTQPKLVVEPALSISKSPVSFSHWPVQALMVANVVARKGILPFLEALSELADAADHFSLRIIGRTDMEKDYAQRCQQLAASPVLRDKIKLQGPLPYEKTLEQYARHNLFVSAARMETYGMALQEARSTGLPLLLLEGGYSRQHISQGAGRAFTSVFDLAKFFIELCRNPARFIKLGSEAQASVLKQPAYDWQQAAQLFLTQIRNFYP
ncbi:MAG: glycosyltransferase family 4 protein [Cyclobacteriaceae bacterium]